MTVLDVEKDGFRDDNIEGYSSEQLADLNYWLNKELEDKGIESYSDDYYTEIKAFSDKIAHLAEKKK